MGSFGRDGREWKRVRDLMCELFAAHGYPHPPLMMDYTAYWPIEDAAQLLEHSEMLYKMASENEVWRPTRLGLATLALGKAAVRQRIKDRTGL